MNRRDDPLALVPVALAGIALGLVMMGGGGYLAFVHGTTGTDTRRGPRHAQVEGRVAWAGWRTSGAGEGPNRFLQLRFEDDDRGFLVAAGDLPRAHRERFEHSRAGGGEISSLVGRAATVAVDSALLNEETPYISGLRVGEETIISVGGETSDSPGGWRRTALLVLYWMGVLVGLGMLGASVQHVLVCVWHRRKGAG